MVEGLCCSGSASETLAKTNSVLLSSGLILISSKEHRESGKGDPSSIYYILDLQGPRTRSMSLFSCQKRAFYFCADKWIKSTE